MPAVKLNVERDVLAPALAVLVKIVERRNTIPILSNVRVLAENGRLYLTATDLDIEMSLNVAAEVFNPGTFTVEAARLHDIVRKLAGGALITIEQADQDGQVVVKAGRSRFTLFTLPATDFPDIAQKGNFAHEISLSGATFARLLAQLEFCISTEETRYYLNGIYLHVVDVAGVPTLRGVATDGHRLGRADTNAATGLDTDMPGIIIPRKAAGELRRLCEASAEASVALSISSAQLRAEVGETLFATKLIDGTFPDYARVIPSANPHRLRFGIADLNAALARVMVVVDDRSRAVRLAASEGTLALNCTNPDKGTAADEVEAEYDGPPLEIGFNGKYLAEMLGAIESETLIAHLADPGSPGVFRASDDADHLFVLMPMRV